MGRLHVTWITFMMLLHQRHTNQFCQFSCSTDVNEIFLLTRGSHKWWHWLCAGFWNGTMHHVIWTALAASKCYVKWNFDRRRPLINSGWHRRWIQQVVDWKYPRKWTCLWVDILKTISQKAHILIYENKHNKYHWNVDFSNSQLQNCYHTVQRMCNIYELII